MAHASQGGVSGGSVVLKICHTAPDGCHYTRPGVSCGAMADVFAFEFFLLISEEETD